MKRSKKEKQPETIQKVRRVLIATPVAYDSSLSIYYVDALVNSIKLAATKNIELFPVYLANDVLVQRARNSLIAIAVEAQVDDLVWIDSDIQWNPEWLVKLLQYPVDVVGGTYPKKIDTEEQYPVHVTGDKIPIDQATRLMEVDGLGGGFLRLSRKALQALWDDPSSKPYNNRGKPEKWICEVLVENGEVIGEDIVLCRKLATLGFKIYLDPSMCCNHVGAKVYSGNFIEYLKTLQPK